MRTLLVSVLVGVVCLVVGVLAGVLGTLGVQQASGSRTSQAADRAACRSLDVAARTGGVRGVARRVGYAALRDPSSSSDGTPGTPFDAAIDTQAESTRLTTFLRRADSLAQQRDLGSATYRVLSEVAGRTTTLRDDLVTPPDNLSDVATAARSLTASLDRASSRCGR